MDTIRSLIDTRARKQPDAVFLISPEINYQLSYGDLQLKAQDISAHLKGLGLQPQEKVAFLMGNGLWSAAIFLGTMYSGCVVVPLNVVSGQDQLGYVVGHCDAKVIFADAAIQAQYADIFASLAPDIIVIVTSADTGPQWPERVTADTAEQPAPLLATDPALLIYTSGTTGRPKGVLLSHKAVLAGGQNTVLAHHLTADDRALCSLQLYHINGEIVTVIAPLVSGGSVVMPYKFSVSEFWNFIDTWQCSWFSLVPTMIAYLLEQAERLQQPPSVASDRPYLRFGRSASAPLSPHMHRQFERQFAVSIIETMGLSETAAQILSNPMTAGLSKYGSPGIAVGNEAMIIDDQGHEQVQGRPGELMIRGDNLMTEYYKDPQATAATIRPDGWLHTGDLAYEDEEGYFFITGRLKEIIIKGGENIAPREIDEVLYQHSAVLEAAAFPVPDQRYGQEILACVSLKPGTSCTAEALRELCLEKLGSFKTPKSITFMDELPKGPSGKIQRLKLTERAATVD